MPPLTQYATRDQLRSRVTDAGALNRFTPQQQDDALLGASKRFDSHCRSQFQLPFTYVGKDVVDSVCDVAWYDLLSGKGISHQQNPVDGTARTKRDDAVRWWELISANLATPDVTDSSGSPRPRRLRVRGQASRGYRDEDEGGGGRCS